MRSRTTIAGFLVACTALLLGCAKPNKYIPWDADPDDAGLTEEVDGPLARTDVAGTAPDSAISDGSPLDTSGRSVDTAVSPPDGPCGTPADPRNCGTCGHDCTKLANIGAPTMVTCQAGACVVPPAACASGYTHCSSNADDGCETNLSRPETCGRCSNRCNAGELCASASGTYQCVSGCSGATPDKCGTSCTDLRSDPRNCLSCGHDCSQLPHLRAGAPVTCSGGTCGIPSGSCATGWVDCNGRPDDGCETDLSRPETCGGCNVRCDTGKVCTASGSSFQCGCAAATPETCMGQCTNVQTDSRNCGTCAHDCSLLANVRAGATVSCQGGHCVIPASSCSTGYGHCGAGPADNGCETNISVPQTCGCSSCGTGQVCTPSGSSYGCTCGGGTTMCGGACVNLQNDSQNCGACGHSCLGGACQNNVCQLSQIYSGTDVVPGTLAVDSTYVYFKRSKAAGVTVLSRMPKAGGQAVDLTNVDEGEDNVALMNGVLYWAKGSQINACSAPSCSSRFTISNQLGVSYVTASADHSRLFWTRVGSAPATGEIMTNPSSPTIQATISNSPIFLAMVAVGSYAYVTADNTVYRVSGGAPDIVPIGDSPFWGLAVNSQSVFGLSAPDGDGGPVAAVKYSLSAIGTPQTLVELGRYTFHNGRYGLVADDSNTYWLIGSTTESALRLLRCSVSGCGNAPAELGYVRASPLNSSGLNWLTMEPDAIYLSAPSGIFRLAR